jgi:hypothetical protein
MSDSRDQIPDNGASPDVSEENKPLMRKVGMIDPGFRDFEETSVLRPRILGIKTPQDSRDRRNLKLLGAALIVAILIFGILEYRQIRLSVHEAKQSAMGFFDQK